MLTILVLFVGLTLATAVIAYWSDNLGKKLGKKRVSLWGMRPRTTATFLTIASSWLIMVFTLSVMLTIFPPLRRSLLRYDEVKANESKLSKSAKKLTGTVGDLNGQLTALREQTQSLKDQVSYASGNLAKVQGQLAQSRAAATQARKARGEAQQAATQARKNARSALARQNAAVAREQAARDNLQKVRVQLGATQQQRQAAQQKLSRAQGNLKRARDNVKIANDKVEAANARVAQADAEVARAERQLASVQSNLARVQTDLLTAQTNEKTAQQNAKLAENRAALAENRAALAENRAAVASERAVNAGKAAIDAGKAVIDSVKQVAQAQKKVDELEAQSKKLREDNEILLAENENFADVTGVLLSSDVRVPVGTILAAQNFPQGTSFYEAKENLSALFARAETIVLGNKENNIPSLLPGAQLTLSPRLVPAPNIESSDTQKFVSVEGEEIYNGLAEAISRSQNPLSVRLISERNHLLGDDKLSVRFVALPIRPALPVSYLLASAQIDGQNNDAKIFKDLSTLVEIARQVATQQGVAPPLWRDSANFYAPGSNEEIFGALRAINAVNGPARVRIITTQPISTADQLSVKFEVEPLSSATTQATARRAPLT